MTDSLRYSDTVMDHYRNPRNVGEIAGSPAVAQVGDPATGDVLKISLKIVDGVVVQALFKSFGCTAAIASGSIANDARRGEDDRGGRTSHQPGGGSSPWRPARIERIQCSVLAQQAIQEALRRHDAALTRMTPEVVRCGERNTGQATRSTGAAGLTYLPSILKGMWITLRHMFRRK